MFEQVLGPVDAAAVEIGDGRDAQLLPEAVGEIVLVKTYVLGDGLACQRLGVAFLSGTGRRYQL